MFACYDLASALIKIQERKGWIVNEEKRSKFEKLCSGIDEFVEGDGICGCSNSYGIDVDIDADSREIIIGIEFDQYYLEDDSSMYNVLQEANDINISMSNENDDAARMVMRFPGVWD